MTKLSDLSNSQRYLLLECMKMGGSRVIESRSAAAASLVRKGLATKVYTQDPLSVRIDGYGRGQRVRVTLTPEGRDLALALAPSQGDVTPGEGDASPGRNR